MNIICLFWNHKPVYDDDPNDVWYDRCNEDLVEGEDYKISKDNN